MLAANGEFSFSRELLRISPANIVAIVRQMQSNTYLSDTFDDFIRDDEVEDTVSLSALKYLNTYKYRYSKDSGLITCPRCT